MAIQPAALAIGMAEEEEPVRSVGLQRLRSVRLPQPKRSQPSPRRVFPATDIGRWGIATGRDRLRTAHLLPKCSYAQQKKLVVLGQPRPLHESKRDYGLHGRFPGKSRAIRHRRAQAQHRRLRGAK
jgi:hypothetical protein